MRSNQAKFLGLIVIICCAIVMINSLTGIAGSLQPDQSPGPTMLTLGDLSQQISSVSSGIDKVVRGVIDFSSSGPVEVTQQLPEMIDPNRCVVSLSDAVATEYNDDPEIWRTRNGACLIELTESQITVRIEEQWVAQKVSYQIIEYK